MALLVDVEKFIKDLESHVGEALGRAEKAAAAVAKSQFAALTPAIWAEVQALAGNLVMQVEKSMVDASGTVKWNQVLAAFTHGLEDVGIQGVKVLLSQSVKDTLLQDAVIIVKAAAVAALA